MNYKKLIKEEKVTIKYCKEETEKLYKIAKSLGIEIGRVKICKIINGVKRCGLKKGKGKHSFVASKKKSSKQ